MALSINLIFFARISNVITCSKKEICRQGPSTFYTQVSNYLACLRHHLKRYKHFLEIYKNLCWTPLSAPNRTSGARFPVSKLVLQVEDAVNTDCHYLWFLQRRLLLPAIFIHHLRSQIRWSIIFSCNFIFINSKYWSEVNPKAPLFGCCFPYERKWIRVS